MSQVLGCGHIMETREKRDVANSVGPKPDPNGALSLSGSVEGVMVSDVSPASRLPHLHGLINRNLFSNSSGNQMSEIKVLTRWVSSGGV